MKIKKCRICGNKELVEIGTLGQIAVSDFTKQPSKGKKVPLTLVYCPECTLLQLLHNTPRKWLYSKYWYRSAINPVIVEDLKEIAEYAKTPGVLIHVDIGGNDGTLIKNSVARVKCVVDPSNIYPEGDITWIRDYWENIEPQTADLITAIACIYDLPDPNKFMQNIKNSLTKQGIFIAQLMTLQPMIENNDVGNICHEHLEFYSYKSLVRLYEQNGLEIYKVEKNSMNGGSYRLFARHFKRGSIKLREKEYSVKDLKKFFQRIEENKLNFIRWAVEGKVKLAGYGASTKANTILQYYGIRKLPIVDVNPDKVGKYMIATECPIVGEIPDVDYLWVFPYGFIKTFKAKEKNFKGKWITTIPKFHVDR